MTKGETLALEEFPPFGKSLEIVKDQEELKEKTEENFDSLIDNVFSKLMNMSENEEHGAVSIIERELIKRALQNTGNNQLKAAKILKINRNTLANKIKKYDILSRK